MRSYDMDATICFSDLAYGIIHQAVEDVKSLRASGILVGERYPHTFPRDSRGKTLDYLNYYDSPVKIQELLYFFKSTDLDKMLKVANSNISGDAICSKLKIKRL